MNTTRVYLRLFVTLALLAAVPALARRLHPGAYEGGRSRNTEAHAQRNSSAAGAMFGEFRTALSDIMFIKTERYLHSGIAYMPHMERQLMTVDGSIAEVNEHQEEVAEGEHAHHEGETAEEHAAHSDEGLHHDPSNDGTQPLIPDSKRDFRGFIGELHRRVKPWRDPSQPHLHTDGRELLPWFRVMTLSDPNYIRGYAVGGWWLQRRNMEEAVKFVEEGLRNNPNSFQILYTYGNLFLERGRVLNHGQLMNPTPEALKEFLAARDQFKLAAENAIKVRPAGWTEEKGPATWSWYMEDDTWSSARMAVLTEKNYGDSIEAVKLARHYLETLGEDPTMRRIVDESPW